MQQWWATRQGVRCCRALCTHHTEVQPPTSWKLKATSTPMSLSVQVMMVSSAHATSSEQQSASMLLLTGDNFWRPELNVFGPARG